jgi:hypothetical protein
MYTIRVLLFGCLLALTSTAAHTTQTAQARLHCWSLRFGGASAWGSLGFLWDVNVTTISQSYNGEVTLNPFTPSYTHFTYVDWYDALYEELLQGELDLDVPDAGDANGNGFPDFFEISQQVNSLPAQGFLRFYGFVYEEPVQAFWYRAAGSSSGTCSLYITDPFNPFSTILFNHSFQLIEYNGVLTYVPGAGTVSSALSVTNNAISDTLLGPLLFQKSAINPANDLALESADLTNAFFQTLGLYSATDFTRESTHPTNYFGPVEFLDGDLNTSEADYYSWQLSIDDLNDSNVNGIPDFSDTPGSPPANEPDLTLTRGSGNLLLTVSGEVGVLHHIERASAPSGAPWTIATSVTLTNDPQVITLPLPTSTTFWRARVPVGSP